VCGCATCLELEARLLGVSSAHIVRVEGEARLRGLRCQVRILPLQENGLTKDSAIAKLHGEPISGGFSFS
jgi:hypothetical protein